MLMSNGDKKTEHNDQVNGKQRTEGSEHYEEIYPAQCTWQSITRFSPMSVHYCKLMSADFSFPGKALRVTEKTIRYVLHLPPSSTSLQTCILFMF